MKMSEAFPSEYLRAADLQGRSVKVTIDRIEMRDVGDDHKPVLYFQGKEKGVVLNKTNALTISQVYGDDSDAWSGQPIELFSMMVSFQGKMQPGIRVRVPVKPSPRVTTAKATPQPEAENPAVDMDDEVPF